MAEYIEREALLDKWEYDSNSRLVVTVKNIIDIPAADVVEVVRCKDCKHRHSSEFCECRPADGFCNDGERRTE